jgi:hypothetical protein
MKSARLSRCVRLLLASAGVMAIVTIAPLLHAAQNWTVYLHHSGPLAIGMTVDEARKALGDADAHLAFGDREPDDAECSYLESPRLPAGLTVIFQNGKLTRMDVWGSSDIHTASGAHIGEDESQVIATYRREGRVDVSPHPYLQQEGHYVEWHPRSATDSGLSLLFETMDGKVTSYRFGLVRAVAMIEGCS